MTGAQAARLQRLREQSKTLDVAQLEFYPSVCSRFALIAIEPIALQSNGIISYKL